MKISKAKVAESDLIEAITDGEDIELDLLVKGNESDKTCYDCVHFRETYTCPAYPKGIPAKYLTSEETHDRVQRTQDEEIVFEAL